MFFAVRPDGGVPSLPKVIVDLNDAAGAWFAPLPFVGLKGAGSRFSGSSFYFSLRLCLSNPLVDLCRRCPLHLICHMSVDVQGGGAAGHMTDDGGECFYVHSMFQRDGDEGMSQFMEPNVR